jgi:thiosulfate reductase cytochrome b subunit
MKRIIKKHPLAIRWLHWINFPVIALMVWSGMLIYWANDVYKLGWGNRTLLKFFPRSFYQALHIPYHLAEGMGLHFFFMWFFALNGFIYVLYLIFSGEWRLIVPNKRSFKESIQVVLHDLHLRKTAPAQKKYNAAQRVAYTGVIIMGIGSVLTGLSIYKPIQFRTLCSMLGGYEAARVEHFTLTILFALFFLVHIVQVILAGWNNFSSMVTGLEVLPLQKDIQTSAPVYKEMANEKAVDTVVPVRKVIPEENSSSGENLPGDIQNKNNEKTEDQKEN